MKAVHKKLLNSSIYRFKKYKTYLDNQEIDKAIKEVIELLTESNVYCDKLAPWTLNKENKKQRMNEVLSLLIEIIRRASLMLFPVIPGSVKKVFVILNIKEEKINFDYFDKLPEFNNRLNTSIPIFPRIDNKS